MSVTSPKQPVSPRQSDNSAKRMGRIMLQLSHEPCISAQEVGLFAVLFALELLDFEQQVSIKERS